jgi:hypothetical protein
MDLLNFVIALHDTLRVEIPGADYPRLSTLDGCVRLPGRRGRPVSGATRASPGRGRQRGRA